MGSTAAVLALSALGHAVRLQTYQLLAQSGDEAMSWGDIARRIGTPPNTMSANLAILQRAGLITSERRGKQILYRADPEVAESLAAFLAAKGAADISGSML